MSSEQPQSPSSIDREYKKMVLKVPDCFAVAKDTVNIEMMNMHREIFKVTYF